tara:strand:- start:18814 stop:19809 length:996 start_codon:yes stop_codon:yes gene_type:complete
MIIKSFKINDIKNSKSKFFLLYGENEGHKDEVINNFFINEFKGEIIKYDENQILNNEEIFYNTCLNDSLFDSEKIILVSRVTSKLFEIVKDLTEKNISNKKIILNSETLDKKSKIRQLFEKEDDLICIPFYQDNNYSLYKIAISFFKINKIAVSTENINLIIEKCLGDRKTLRNELNKILNYCFQRNKISSEEINRLINANDQENYFELIDNCLAKNSNQVTKIINNDQFSKAESIILVRSFISRVKRLIELKKLFEEIGDINQAITKFKPPIFWKDKEIVYKQISSWSSNEIYKMLNDINMLELKFKKNYEISNNLIFDFILNTSRATNS